MTHRDPCPHPDCREAEPQDRLAGIKSRYDACRELQYINLKLVDPAQSHVSAEADMEWLIEEIEQLREELAPPWRQVFIEHVAQHTDHTCCFRQELEQRRTR